MTETCRECGRPAGLTIATLSARLAKLERYREAVRVAVERAKAAKRGRVDTHAGLVNLIEELEKI